MESIKAKSNVLIPLATRATRNIRITRIIRRMGSHGDPIAALPSRFAFTSEMMFTDQRNIIRISNYHPF